jgi:hypothetical protein
MMTKPVSAKLKDPPRDGWATVAVDLHPPSQNCGKLYRYPDEFTVVRGAEVRSPIRRNCALDAKVKCGEVLGSGVGRAVEAD